MFELRLPCGTAVIADIWVENAMRAIRPGVAVYYGSAIRKTAVMAGLVPAIHVFLA
jgi:hypothetical protein